SLSKVLLENGWEVIKPKGGLFMVAKPQRFIDENNLDDSEGADLMTQQLFAQQNLVINNSTWTGLPGYCRFVLSCSEKDFGLAIERLRAFVL
ncbi:MAG: hypothetical protein L3J83_03285, partial [Proteobacteria bacterium]|nr:hypothetical protein [Pseudomonadota bacterium]